MSNGPKLLKFKSSRTPGQNAAIAFAVLIVSFVTFGALPTQWFAAQYAYDANLGVPLARFPEIGGLALYLPTDWILWGLRLGDVDSVRSNVHVMMLLGTGSGVLAILFTVFVSHRLSRYSGGMEGLHGTAHWAERDEINNTGFLSQGDYTNSGVVVGSVMLDWRGKVIHPHHPQYAKRYQPKMEKVKDWRRFFGKKVWVRDRNGMPMYTVRKSVVKKIELLKDGKNTHLFAFCPTRSGKGRGMIIPTLVTWPNSVMVNDPKGEAYALTAGFRQSVGQEIIKFEPACTDGTGARWNPLSEIRVFTPYDVQDAQMIMSMACDPKGDGLEDYFDKAGYEFLFGLALHVVYSENNKSLEGVAQFLGDPSWDSDKQMYTHMLNAEHDPEGKMGWKDAAGKPTKTHPIVANVAKTMLNKEDKDRSGVLSTAKSLLSLYLDPIVAKNTNCSDFLVRDLMTHHRPVSLYYVVGPADMQRLTPLTRLFYALFIRRNAAEMEFAGGRSKDSYTFPLLMIIDEMTSLKKLEILEEALGYVAGYGIRMFMLVQDIAQVESFYTDKQTIDSGAETRVVYAPNKPETADKIVKMAGKTTVTEQKASTSRDIVGLKSGSVSVSVDKVARDLITPEEIMTLNDMDVIIFVKGQPPIYGRKAWYDENPVMLGRAKMPPPARSSTIRTAIVPGEIDMKKKLDGGSKTTAAGNGLPDAEAIQGQWSVSNAMMAARARMQSSGGSSAEVVAAGDGTDGETITVGPASRTGGGDVSAEGKKSRSRYATAVAKNLTEVEKKQISALVADVALTERVMRISAF